MTEERKNEILKSLDEDIMFLSPNEPLTQFGVQRIIDWIKERTKELQAEIGYGTGKSITIWDPNVAYSSGDIVLYFKQETKQIDPNVGLREFAFILISNNDNNTSTPRYVMVDGIPDFTKTGWNLLNPMSYLLQDLVGMKKVVKEVFEQILSNHMVVEHGTVGVQDIKRNLLRKDYANLTTGWLLGNKSVDFLDESGIRLKSNGTMEISI